MVWNIDTATTTFALSRAEAKLHLNILDTSFDDLIDDYLGAAHDMLWREAGISAGDQTLVAYMKAWKDVEIPFERVSSITSIKYYDENNSQQTLSSANYSLYNNQHPTLIDIDSSPSLYDREDAIEIKIVTGYTVVPEAVKQVLRMMVADMFENRQSDHKGAVAQLSRATNYQMSLISRRTEI